MERRQFNLALADAALMSLAGGSSGRGQERPTRTALYNSVGDLLTHWDVDVEAATLTRRDTIKVPSAIQYGWPHPSRRYLYVSTTDADPGATTIAGEAHFLVALRVGPDGTLTLHGAPQPLRQRPVHNSVDHAGRYVLTC